VASRSSGCTSSTHRPRAELFFRVAEHREGGAHALEVAVGARDAQQLERQLEELRERLLAARGVGLVRGLARLEAHALRHVLDLVHEERERPRGVDDGSVERAPEALFEASAVGGGPLDVVALQRHAVRRERLTHTLERRAQVGDARGQGV
jgi:hypothetical protein